ncbi:MAG: DegV family EDD domain-containing protein [Xanthomonadales bacterium]|nr:DegV family EDD domain-containing protein [Gammaproteobacteria bacterium]MBT8054565.1 DegV family EDD domain-containing protein [Gammaproteobacteria bacterium]NND56857.1 DegV family EDD domain-containing protein [Xanthomonadales bacterium]NNK52724.1 DegV family EDD domain-containing protein [Xanthomonadales bacterium]
MRTSSTAIAYLDAPRMLRALSAGIGHVFQRREYLNRINVFPVPDGDTGTNMAFTFKTILEATATSPDDRIDDLLNHVADAALDGARGNSGAIMAQYLHGFREAVTGQQLLTAERFALAAKAGAAAAWTAMSKPVPGTLPTVLEDFSLELTRRVAEGVNDIQVLFKHGLERAQVSLANTPNQLPVLKQAGVVDAGGQGFVDLLDGIWAYIVSGEVDSTVADLQHDLTGNIQEFDVGEHRFCTECVVEGEHIDRNAVMTRLEGLDSSSLVVAGGQKRVRVHIHVNNPAEVFLVCEEFGQIKQQKADDMERQHGLLDHAGEVAVVTDSGADIPSDEVERLGIHVVPVRLSFGATEYLDGVSLTPEDFYRLLSESEEAPLTSQPPSQDFSRVYSLLTSHGYGVISVGLSEHLSGTTAAAQQAASHIENGEVRVIDSLSATAGQGLLAMAAAEAALKGWSLTRVESLVRELIPRTRVFAVADDLTWSVKGGRVPAWVKRIADFLHVNPILTASPEGKMGLSGFHIGSGANPAKLARTLVSKMEDDTMYRVMVAHANNETGATQVRHEILEQHTKIHSCHITDAGPALGVHFGPGGLIAGFTPRLSTST